MEEIKLHLNDQMEGAFYVLDGPERLGEMVIRKATHHITVYHTEVATKAEGRGLASKLLKAMVDYARTNELKVIALCPYVHAQFLRHPEQYADVWLRTEHQ